MKKLKANPKTKTSMINKNGMISTIMLDKLSNKGANFLSNFNKK